MGAGEYVSDVYILFWDSEEYYEDSRSVEGVYASLEGAQAQAQKTTMLDKRSGPKRIGSWDEAVDTDKPVWQSYIETYYPERQKWRRTALWSIEKHTVLS